jgi:ATP-binding protein involved in chromosome partitioning
MSYYLVPGGTPEKHFIFGEGGGREVSETLSQRLGYPVPLLTQVPLDPKLRAGGDDGSPIVATLPDQPAAQALIGLADHLAGRGRGLLGKQLGLAPAGR